MVVHRLPGHGPAFIISFSPLNTVELDPARPMPRIDLVLFTGGGVRFSDRSEVGLRAGVGLLATTVVPVYGTAREHTLSLVYGYLLKGRLPGFTKRRQWKRQVRHTPLIQVGERIGPDRVIPNDTHTTLLVSRKTIYLRTPFLGK